MSIVNRAISLNRGFVTLADSNNYQTGISLMRLQIDNYLRLYAMSLIDDPSKSAIRDLQSRITIVGFSIRIF